MQFLIGANVPDTRITGMGRQMHGVADALLARGHSVHLLFADQVPRILPRRLSRLEYPIQLAIRAWRLAAAEETDTVCILHEPVAWPTALIRTRYLRTFVMVHGSEIRAWDIERMAAPISGLRVPLRSRLVYPATQLTQDWLSLKLGHGVFCLSTEDAKYLRERLKLEPQKIHRIDNGLEPAFLGLPAPDRPRERKVIFLGSWLPRKGIGTLREALSLLSSGHVFFTLTLAGTGLDASTVLKDIPPEWRERTLVYPRVDPADLVNLYQRHEVFALPSVNEGIPLSLLEAMAAGLCPVVTAVGGVPDIIRDKQDGYLVPPLNAQVFASRLEMAVRSPGEAHRVAQRAHAKAQGLTWARVAAQIEAAVGPARNSERI